MRSRTQLVWMKKNEEPRQCGAVRGYTVAGRSIRHRTTFMTGRIFDLATVFEARDIASDVNDVSDGG